MCNRCNEYKVLEIYLCCSACYATLEYRGGIWAAGIDEESIGNLLSAAAGAYRLELPDTE